MYIDKNLQVADAQAVTVSGVSTDMIDFGQTNSNSGMSNHLTMAVTVDATATAAGAATVKFTIQDSADGVTFADVASSADIGKAALTAGAQVLIPMPMQHRRFVQLYYTVTTGPLTAGAFSAQVVTGVQANRAYPDSPRIA